MAVKSSDQVTIVDLTDGYSVMLTMDAISLHGAVSTLGTAQSVTTQVIAYKGGSKVTPTVGTPTCPTNVTASVGSASDSAIPVTINFAAALSTSGKVTIPVTIDDITINKDFTFGIAFKGATGATGETGAKGDTGATGTSAYAYDLIVSHAAITKSNSGTYNPSQIVLTAKRSQGTSSPANYSGRFKIETTADNSTWTTKYTSSANEATYTYTVPADIIAIRCNLYLAGGTSTLLDQQTVPIVLDGAKGDTGATGGTGAAGADAYTVVLSNESHTFAGGTSAAIGATAETSIIGYKGATQVNTTVGTITGAPTGMTTSVSNNTSKTTKVTVTVTTSMTTKSGVLTIPVTVDGKTFNKQFTYSLALTGAKGATGSKGDTGEQGATGATGNTGADAIMIYIEASAGYIFKNNSGSTTLTAHVYKGGSEVTGSALNALGTLKWYKDGGSTSVGSGTSLVVSASDVTNKATYEVRLEA